MKGDGYQGPDESEYDDRPEAVAGKVLHDRKRLRILVQVRNRILHRGKADQKKGETDGKLSDVLLLVAFQGRQEKSDCYERNGESGDVIAETEKRDQPGGQGGTDVRSHDDADGIAQSQKSGIDHADHHHSRTAR